MIRVTLLPWEEARAEASRIRYSVFVEEQRVPEDIELDDCDASSLHALAYDREGHAIGTGRLLPDGHIGRMAVLPAWRGRGAGSSILRAFLEAARGRGHTEVALSAQVHAVDFYRAHGFEPQGEVYEEAGIAHRAMRRLL
jgi:predicted GNAT family N-acyltransferase